MKFIRHFFKETDVVQAMSWAFFDFANSAYSIMIITFVFPIYFKEVIAGNFMGDFYWGLCISLSILAGGISAPIIGAIADYDSQRKYKFTAYTLVAVAGTALLYFTEPNMYLFGAAIFVITNYFFELAVVFYDSFLAHVSTEDTAGRISGLGWGLGYLGGVIAMLLFKPLFENGFAGPLAHNYKLTFVFTALFFLVFSLPAFFFIREEKTARKKENMWHLAKVGIKNTLQTLKEVRKHKNIAWFMVAFYLVNDALVTLFAFIAIYGRQTLSMQFSEIAMILLLIQLIGFPSAILFGWLSDQKGAKKILLFTLAVWCVIIVMISLSFNKVVFYIAAVMAGLVVGSSQAIARSWLSRIIPANKRTEFFGFNGFASKMAATTGPLIFGGISSFANNQRLAMLALLPFFVVSFVIFSRLEEQ
jgi:UMF1 family MFS transporter